MRPGFLPRHPGVFVLLGLLAAVPGCGGATLAVRIEVPDLDGTSSPVSGVRFMLLPYDRDSILRELEAGAPSPRPSTARLDSLFQAFRAPFTDLLRASDRVERLRTGRDALRSVLDTLPRGATDYASRFERLRAIEESLATATPSLEAARARLAEVRSRITPEADSLRRVVQSWQGTAYSAYDSITAALARRTREGAITDSTGADGWALVEVPSGHWWLYARAVNLHDPNAEWYWNVPVAGDTIRLTAANGRSRTRF